MNNPKFLIAIFILLLCEIFSCKHNAVFESVIQEVINSETIISELSKIDDIQRLCFVNVVPRSSAMILAFQGGQIKIHYNEDILENIKDPVFNMSTNKIVIVSVQKIKKNIFETNIYHPSSGLLLVSRVDFSLKKATIIETKIQVV